jgi:hypothetical protein
MKALLIAIAALLAAIMLAPEAQAHGGRTDASGCHRDRSSGDRHCHNGGGGSVLGALSTNMGKKKRSKRKKRRH